MTKTPFNDYHLVNAAGYILTPSIVISAIESCTEPPLEAVVHEEQKRSWFLCAVECNAIEYDGESFPDIKKHKLTLGGIPLRVDSSMPQGTIEFWGKNNKLLCRIENLAIPL